MAERVAYMNGVPTQQQRSKLDTAGNLLLISCTANAQSKWARILQTKVWLHFTVEEEAAAEVKDSVLPNRGVFKCKLTVEVGCLPHTSDVEKCIFAVSPRFSHPCSNRSRWQLLNSPSASFLLSGSRVPAHTTASNISNACRESHVELPVTPNYSEQHAR